MPDQNYHRSVSLFSFRIIFTNHPCKCVALKSRSLVTVRLYNDHFLLLFRLKEEEHIVVQQIFISGWMFVIILHLISKLITSFLR